MSDQGIEESLRQSGLLYDAAESHLSELAAISQLVDFPEGTLILRDGERAEKLFVILSGKVAIEICAPGTGCRRIMTLSDGDLLNWSAVLEHQRSTATARSIEPTKVVAIDGGQLLALCESEPALGYAFMRRVALAMAQRLTATRMQLIDVFGPAMPTAPNEDSGESSTGTVTT